MKSILIVLLLYTINLMSGYNIKEVRQAFYKATESKEAADLFKKRMKDASEKEPLLLGYKGMSEMVMASHSYNPVNKLSYFNTGKKLLEKSIELEPLNTELRFLRLSVQTNAPGFLGYSDKIQQDKKIILAYLSHIEEKEKDEDLYNKIVNFVRTSDHFKESEKK